jgi:hypothetical protein
VCRRRAPLLRAPCFAHSDSAHKAKSFFAREIAREIFAM